MQKVLTSSNHASSIIVKVPEAKQLVFNKTEIDVLLERSHSLFPPFHNHWVLAILTGMRNGELFALTWNDIDFENEVISVTKAWTKKDGLGPTKSSRNRYIPISKELEGFLRNLKSNAVNPDNNVLEHHEKWIQGSQAKVLKDFCREIGITPIRFHDLRATFITQLLIRGVPLAKVMKIVGHSTIKTTMKYLRLVAQDTKGATEALGISVPKTHNIDNVVNLFQN